MQIEATNKNLELRINADFATEGDWVDFAQIIQNERVKQNYKDGNE